jgi:transposase, IS6 family
MSGFRWRHFCGEVILWAVRWYCRYGVSYRDLEEMLRERGVEVGRPHDPLYRWVQRYAPELEKRLARYRSRMSFSWRVDETYVKVKGRWRYLYRAIDKDGATLDFFLSERRSAKAAKRFLGAALKRSRDWIPRVINTDKNPAYGEAIAPGHAQALRLGAARRAS